MKTAWMTRREARGDERTDGRIRRRQTGMKRVKRVKMKPKSGIPVEG